jgi:hypothetical protein
MYEMRENTELKCQSREVQRAVMCDDDPEKIHEGYIGAGVD